MYKVAFSLAPVPMLISAVEVLVPVPINNLPEVCDAPNEILPDCVPPIVREPVCKFEPGVIAVSVAVASTFGVINFVVA